MASRSAEDSALFASLSVVLPDSCGEHGGIVENGEACPRPAGWGTKHRGKGLCRTHGAKKRKGGQPTKYHPSMIGKAYEACILGATNKELAEHLGIGERTFNSLMVRYEQFRRAVKRGRRGVDTDVAHALYDKAIGAEYVEEVAFKVKHTEFGPTGRKVKEWEEVVVVPVRKRAAPDTLAGMYWLNNRHKVHWRQKQVVEHEGLPAGGDTNVHIFIPDNSRGDNYAGAPKVHDSKEAAREAVTAKNRVAREIEELDKEGA